MATRARKCRPRQDRGDALRSVEIGGPQRAADRRPGACARRGTCRSRWRAAGRSREIRTPAAARSRRWPLRYASPRSAAAAAGCSSQSSAAGMRTCVRALPVSSSGDSAPAGGPELAVCTFIGHDSSCLTGETRAESAAYQPTCGRPGSGIVIGAVRLGCLRDAQPGGWRSRGLDQRSADAGGRCGRGVVDLARAPAHSRWR